jgi:hypothetical protein
MKADEIRKLRICRASALDAATPESMLEFQCAMLQEIAAQLAELNAGSGYYRTTGGPSPYDLSRGPRPRPRG